MAPSILLAQWIGLYLLIMCAICLLRREHLIRIAEELIDRPGLIAVAGAFTLIVGLGVVLNHNIWTMDYRGVVTAFGYLMVAAGIVRFGWPGLAKSMATPMLHSPVYWLLILLMGLLGSYLTYAGFS